MCIAPAVLSWSPHSLLNLIGDTPETLVTSRHSKGQTHFADRRCCFSVLKCLQARYRVNLFYTNAGCSLVALNPFQPFSCLYSPELMREYHVALCPQVTLVFEITVLLQSPGVKLHQIYLSKILPQDKLHFLWNISSVKRAVLFSGEYEMTLAIRCCWALWLLYS